MVGEAPFSPRDGRGLVRFLPDLTISGVHSRGRCGRHFPAERPRSSVYLVTRGLDPKGLGQARWEPALNAFAVIFADRMPAAGSL